MDAAIGSLNGGLGSAIAALGVPVVIWGIVLIGMGFMNSRNEYKIKGLLLFVAGAMLVSVMSIVTTIF